MCLSPSAGGEAVRKVVRIKTFGYYRYTLSQSFYSFCFHFYFVCNFLFVDILSLSKYLHQCLLVHFVLTNVVLNKNRIYLNFSYQNCFVHK